MPEENKRRLTVNIPRYLSELAPYPPGKPIDELKRELGIESIIKLASNENNLGPSPNAVKAIQDALSDLHRYPDGSGFMLKKRLSERLGVAASRIVLGNGSNDLIEMLVRGLVQKGNEVVTSHPSFLVYRKVVQANGGINVHIPLSGNVHDLNAIRTAITDRTRLIFLDNPNNPMGTCLNRADFESFLANTPEHVVIVLDEAYIDFVRDQSVPNAMNYVKKDDRLAAIRTFSKAYGLAGLRVGYGIMDERLVGMCDRLRQPFNVNALAQTGALAALDDDEHFKKTLELTWSGIDYLTRELKGLGCEPVLSQTNFVLADVKCEGQQVFEAMLKKGVIIRAMTSFGLPGCIRITAGLKQENERCIQALSEVLKEIRGELNYGKTA